MYLMHAWPEGVLYCTFVVVGHSVGAETLFSGRDVAGNMHACVMSCQAIIEANNGLLYQHPDARESQGWEKGNGRMTTIWVCRSDVGRLRVQPAPHAEETCFKLLS